MKSLEQILQENFNCEKPFLKDFKVNEDGSREPFTKKGAEAYSKLIDTLYSLDEILGMKEYSNILEDIVETLDNIADDYY